MTDTFVHRGISYSKNDCVYLAPGATGTIDEPFELARILSWDLSKSRIQVTWFYRLSDVSALAGAKSRRRGAQAAEPRRLVASMAVEWTSMSGLRGKCTISHSTETRGGSLVLTPDAFFYSTLFDRYTRRTYTILPLEDIHNLPDNLLSCLVHQRLSSILVEEGSEESYKSLRTCRGCQVWCSPLVPVVFCVTCSGAFHLSCGGLSKPLARGFAWQCLGCLRAGMLSSDPSSSAADEVEKDTDTRENNANGDVTIADGDITMADETSQSVYLASLNSPYLNDEALVKEILEREVPMEPSFPFRYFGEYSRFEDLLTDPEGRPKAVSRLGKSYQVACLPEPFGYRESVDAQNNTNEGLSFSATHYIPTNSASEPKKKMHWKKKKALAANGLAIQDTILERGTAAELVYSPSEVPPEKLTDLMDKLHAFYSLTRNNADLVDAALAHLKDCDWDVEKTYYTVTQHSLQDLLKAYWTPEEINAFEQAVISYGFDLRFVKKAIPSKTMKQLVPFFYKWKKSSRYIPIYSQHCLEYRQSKSFKKSRAQKTEEPLGSLFDDPETLTKQSQPLHACDQEMDSDSDSSVSSLSAISELESSLNSSPDQECAVCGSSSTDRWRRRTTARHEQLIVCSDCHIYWLKYASSRPDADMLKKKYRDERLRRKKEIEEGLLKKRKYELKAVPVVPAIKPVEPFVLKIEYEPDEPEETIEEREGRPCAVCKTGPTDDAIIAMCYVCHLRVHRSCYGIEDSNLPLFICARCSNDAEPETSLNYECVICCTKTLGRWSPVKRTIGNKWAHLSCAIWQPEIKFGSATTLEPIECVGRIEKELWEKDACKICQKSAGFTVRCSERNCPTFMHVSCAVSTPEYMLQFEVLLDGKMEILPAIYCIQHARKRQSRMRREEDELSQPQLLQQYILQQKVSKELVTIGDRRAFSNELSDICKCHSTKARHAEAYKSKNEEIQRMLQSYKSKSCGHCQSDCSPYWWVKDDLPSELQDKWNSGAYYCQSCMWSLRSQTNPL